MGASAEGKLPRNFVLEELDTWGAEHCDYDRYLSRNQKTIEMIQEFHDAKLKLICFTNSPRRYALRCLEFLGLGGSFPRITFSRWRTSSLRASPRRWLSSRS